MDEPVLGLICRDVGDSCVVELSGELDIATAPALRRAIGLALLDAGEVVVDLRGVSFVDSSGLRALLLLRERAQRSGRRLALVPGGERIQRVFAVAGLLREFEWAAAPGGP